MNLPDAVQLIQLELGKANAIDEAFLDTVERGLDAALAKNKKAIVLTGHGKFFSAGLDLKGLPESRSGMGSFVARFDELNRKLLQFPLPVVSAVNGHAIAGGCVIACTGDLRIGAEGSYKIGVSEVSLGIVFPASAFEIMRHTVSPPFTAEVLLGGKLLSPEEAKAAGILHHVVPSEGLLDVAVARARELGEKPGRAFRHSKLALRAPVLERIEASETECRHQFLESWFAPDVVERRKAMLS